MLISIWHFDLTILTAKTTTSLKGNKMKITITKGDDFHCHFRQGEMTKRVIGFTANHFCRGLAMPNTVPSIVTSQDVTAYRNALLAACPLGSTFKPIMAVMLTKTTTPQTIREAAKVGALVLKYIPEGVSVNSNESIPLNHLPSFYHVLETAQQCGMIFSGHWEAKYGADDIEISEINREEAAIPYLADVIRVFPDMRIIAEHASTKHMIEFVRHASRNVASTITVHHALLSYRAVCNLDGEISDPFHYCKPILKSIEDMVIVLKAMLSGDPHFFFGSDTAPHPMEAKQKTPPAAGIFSAPVALPLLAQIFADYASFNHLEAFISHYGADFYRLPRNTEKITLVQEDWVVPEDYNGVVPLMAGQTLSWKVTE